ncbi:MAG: sugar phosphate isomerase/epimerase [Fibrobacter sp.]|nr:sugar phosphate isomerase/epimerase [Fibrobacter sp.]
MVANERIYLQFDKSKSSEMQLMINKNGYEIEISDFSSPLMYDDGKDMNSIIEWFLNQNINYKNSSFHAPFIGLQIKCRDSGISTLSRNRIETSIEIANKLGCSKFIAHTGINPLASTNVFSEIVDFHVNYWENLAEKYPDIVICLENVWENDDKFFISFFEKIKSKNIKMCFDLAHAIVYSDTPYITWLNDLSEYIVHVHLCNNNLKEDNHYALDKGDINISNSIHKIEEILSSPTYLLEVFSVENTKTSIEYLYRNGIVSKEII